MKTICVLQDAAGNLRAFLATNPDLARRERARDTGMVTYLLWTSLAPSGLPPAAIITALNTRVLPPLAGRCPSGQPRPQFYLVLAWATLVAPALGCLYRRHLAVARRRLLGLVRGHPHSGDVQ